MHNKYFCQINQSFVLINKLLAQLVHVAFKCILDSKNLDAFVIANWL